MRVSEEAHVCLLPPWDNSEVSCDKGRRVKGTEQYRLAEMKEEKQFSQPPQKTEKCLFGVHKKEKIPLFQPSQFLAKIKNFYSNKSSNSGPCGLRNN